MGKYYVMDLETTVRNKGDDAVGKFQANPHNKNNSVVLHAVKEEGKDYPEVCVRGVMYPPPDDMDLLIGQNLGFDMQYLLRNEAWREWFRSPKSKIWDTMIAEYIISGQHDKYIDLNALSARYGGTQKDLRIEEYWDAGYETEDIPQNELEQYAKYDVVNTETVFLAQIEIAHQQGQLDLIMAMMESRMATIDMEYTGFAFNRQGAIGKRSLVKADAEEKWTRAQHLMDKMSPDVPIDVRSSLQLSKFLLGGVHMYRVREFVLDDDGQPVKYKSGLKKGQIRKRWVTKTHNFNVQHRLDFTPPSTEKVNNDGWKMDDKVLSEVIGQLNIDGVDIECLGCLQYVREARTIQKDLTAFYEPFINLTWTDGCLHPQFHHTATDTGRLSCSAPNIQQVSGGDD
jgi:DNA polymerase I-like protein with 3'-5' exonuclease and polymerase domains